MYSYKYNSSKENAFADYLSRAPLQEFLELQEQEDVLLIEEKCLKELPLTAKTEASKTQRYPCLAKARQLTLEGWPSWCGDNDLKPYSLRKPELTVEQGCVL